MKNPKINNLKSFFQKNNFKSIIITLVMMIMVWLVYSSLEAMEIYFGEQRFEYSLGNNIY
jgi:predicted negative regulator of RcsB-dependent stress response